MANDSIWHMTANVIDCEQGRFSILAYSHSYRSSELGLRGTFIPPASMPCLPVAEIGELVLRQTARPVPIEAILTSEFQEFLIDLVDTLRARKGVGIAAPQVFRSVRAIAIECSDNPRYPDIPDIPLMVLINPEILQVSTSTCSFTEGCLSVPERRGEVDRPDWIRVTAYNSSGHREDFTATGFTARILLHEIDHLDGVLFVDRLSEDPAIATPASLPRSTHL